MAQTKGRVKRKSSSHFKIDPSLYGTVRTFSLFFPQYRRSALFTRTDPRCILEPLVDMSPTMYRTIHLCDRTSKGFRLSHRRIESTQRFKSKEEINSRSYKTPPLFIVPNIILHSGHEGNYSQEVIIASDASLRHVPIRTWAQCLTT